MDAANDATDTIASPDVSEAEQTAQPFSCRVRLAATSATLVASGAMPDSATYQRIIYSLMRHVPTHVVSTGTGSFSVEMELRDGVLGAIPIISELQEVEASTAATGSAGPEAAGRERAVPTPEGLSWGVLLMVLIAAGGQDEACVAGSSQATVLETLSTANYFGCTIVMELLAGRMKNTLRRIVRQARARVHVSGLPASSDSARSCPGLHSSRGVPFMPSMPSDASSSTAEAVKDGGTTQDVLTALDLASVSSALPTDVVMLMIGDLSPEDILFLPKQLVQAYLESQCTKEVIMTQKLSEMQLCNLAMAARSCTCTATKATFVGPHAAVSQSQAEPMFGGQLGMDLQGVTQGQLRGEELTFRAWFHLVGMFVSECRRLETLELVSAHLCKHEVADFVYTLKWAAPALSSVVMRSCLHEVKPSTRPVFGGATFGGAALVGFGQAKGGEANGGWKEGSSSARYTAPGRNSVSSQNRVADATPALSAAGPGDVLDIVEKAWNGRVKLSIA